MGSQVAFLAGLACLAACSSGAGGGGAGFGAGAAYSGGAPGVPCNPEFQDEGCVVLSGSIQRVKCTGTAWVGAGTCVGSETCQEKAQGATKKTAVCISFGATPTDIGNTPGPDASGQDTGSASGNDGTLGNDSKVEDVQAGTDAVQVSDVQAGTDALGPDAKDTDSQVKDVSPIDIANGTDAIPGPVCGNAKCEEGESPETCPPDCLSKPVCGDGTCNGNENGQNCTTDCANCPGDSWCSCAENGECSSGVCASNASGTKKCAQLCSGSCPAGYQCKEAPVAGGDIITACIPTGGGFCGDTKCQSFESQTSCAQDCKPATQCGNGVCNSGESFSNCPADCKCGNGVCDGTETSSSCSIDCKTNLCGNAKCDSGETSVSCPKDCPVAGLGCSGKCGSSGKNAAGGTCYCDAQCVASKDCCTDYTTFCGSCTKQCTGKTCGPDGCNGTCGSCAPGTTCNTSGVCASTSKCGNGVCDSVETSSSCPSDCPVTSIGCKGKCGSSSKTSSGATCYCDSQCAASKDCCADKLTYCP